MHYPKAPILAARLLAGTAVALTLAAIAAPALAAEADAPPKALTGVGGEGASVGEVVVTAERNKAAQDAPSKGSLEEMQPESVIGRQFISQVTPQLGDWTSVAAIAPSMSGITSNGGGIGEYNKLTMRGFQDGQFNVTFDGIAFGDTNDPTHHSASYFPASTIGAVVIDRGPGAAGDLGQANFGGAIHFFSLDPADTFGVDQKFTYGSFNTKASVTTINSGEMNGGAKAILNFDMRNSDGELSHSGGYEANQMLKFTVPVGENFNLTLFAAREETRFNLADAGPGQTYQQRLLYGKDFALNEIPNDEHNYKFNYEYKTSDFEYADLKGQVTPTISVELQPYTYFYANKTTAANDVTGQINNVGGNTSPPNVTKAPQSSSDIGGYDKLNEYRVVGNIVRLNKDWSFGTLKIGGLVEGSSTNRHNIFVDLTLNGYPDNKFSPPKYPFTTNAKLQEDSSWFQWQTFMDFYWKPTDKLTIAPGFKYVHFERDVNAANENVAGGTKNQTLVGSNTYTKPLYFFTANYKILSDWAVYGQVATSFLVPSLSFLYTNGVNLQGLQPQTTISYQAGTVYTHGHITVDADVYRVDGDNIAVACNIADPTAANPTATSAGFCNAGKARWSGVEGEGAYAFDFGLTVFANGSLNSAKQLGNPANPAAGIAGNPAQTLQNAPKWTYAAGGIYHNGPWALSLTYKNSGAYVAGYNGTQGIHLPGYDTFDASVRYDVNRRLYLQFQAFNLADKRAITTFSGSVLNSVNDTGLYTYQAGRTLEGTIAARF